MFMFYTKTSGYVPEASVILYKSPSLYFFSKAPTIR